MHTPEKRLRLSGLPTGLLSYTELLQLIEQGVVTNATEAEVNSTSIDITLGDIVLYEGAPRYAVNGTLQPVFIKAREAIETVEHDLNEKPFFLYPGQFVLAHSRQVFNLPNFISAEYKLKSSMARVGLEHLNAGWCDAGWNGSVLTLELKNMTQNHVLVLQRNMFIGQMVFFKHTPVPHDKSYAARGRYNNDRTAKGIKQ